ncbi:Chaperone protein DnaJ [Streptococcus pneumoniae]|nr:Chaperone protein DnaJ [Streptococcus pneumoniae]
MTERQKELMKEFADINGEELTEQPSNFKDKAKRFFKGE